MRARLVRLVMQLDVVVDDGDNLTPVQLNPLTINAADWPTWSLQDALAEVERLIAQRQAPADYTGPACDENSDKSHHEGNGLTATSPVE